MLEITVQENTGYRHRTVEACHVRSTLRESLPAGQGEIRPFGSLSACPTETGKHQESAAPRSPAATEAGASRRAAPAARYSSAPAIPRRSPSRARSWPPGHWRSRARQATGPCPSGSRPAGHRRSPRHGPEIACPPPSPPGHQRGRACTPPSRRTDRTHQRRRAASSQKGNSADAAPPPRSARGGQDAFP